ncbi:hypothetical protein DRO42_00020 [Candidatus Bathyarchaeota archaeon]|nr:MAG: hypothetical protein DRO42_00020 [Candidatus Bathyarchaeota archaeon]
MKKLTIIYSPQCPWNTHFMGEITNWASSHDVEIEEIDVFEAYETAKTYLEKTTIGFTRHMFITVFVDGEWVPGHPGNPEFKTHLLKALGEATDD